MALSSHCTAWSLLAHLRVCVCVTVVRCVSVCLSGVCGPLCLVNVSALFLCNRCGGGCGGRGGGSRSGGGRGGGSCRGGGSVFGSATARETKSRFFRKLAKRKNYKTLNKSMKINKTVDFGGARQKRMALSNSARSTTIHNLIFIVVRSKMAQNIVHARP